MEKAAFTITNEEVVSKSPTCIQVKTTYTFTDNQQMDVFEWNPVVPSPDSTPVVIASGWCLSARPYFAFAERIATGDPEKGVPSRNVIAFTAPYGVEANRLRKEYSDVPYVELTRLAVLDVLMLKTRSGKIDIVGHSEGAYYSTLFAVHNMHKVRRLVLLTPSGISTAHLGNSIGSRLHLFKSHAWQLFSRLFSISKGHLLDALRAAFNETLFYAVSQPRHAWDSVKFLAGADITDDLMKLRSHGVFIAVLVAAEDKTFEIAGIAKNLKSEMVDYWTILEGSHLDPIFDKSGSDEVSKVLSQIL